MHFPVYLAVVKERDPFLNPLYFELFFFSSRCFFSYLQGNAYDEDDEYAQRGAGVQCQSQ